MEEENHIFRIIKWILTSVAYILNISTTAATKRLHVKDKIGHIYMSANTVHLQVVLCVF